jgi:YD repeat-containing protein
VKSLDDTEPDSRITGNLLPLVQLTALVQGDLMLSNLLTTTLTYDDATTKRGWLTRTQVVTSTATLLDLNLGYAANGDVSSMTQQAGGPNSPVFTNTYTYDDLDRLASATSNLFANETYSFDALGRMTSRTIGDTSYPYAYGDSAHKDAPTEVGCPSWIASGSKATMCGNWNNWGIGSVWKRSPRLSPVPLQ